MTSQQIELVEGTWGQMAGSPDEVAALLYGTLFSAHPELRPLFTGDSTEQGRKLMQSLAFVVAGLRGLAEAVGLPAGVMIRGAEGAATPAPSAVTVCRNEADDQSGPGDGP